jgi:hypothetical protein
VSLKRNCSRLSRMESFTMPNRSMWVDEPSKI